MAKTYKILQHSAMRFSLLFLCLFNIACFHSFGAIQEVDLRLNGKPIKIDFSPNQYEYKIDLPLSGSLSFSAELDNAQEGVSINFNGKEYTDHSIVALSKGESILTYQVKNKDSEVSTSYNFIITSANDPLSRDVRSLSIYQIMVASFLHGEGGADGYSDLWASPGHRTNGNLRGVIDALPYIKDLGMNAIWMTPIFDSSDNPDIYGDKIRATGYFPSDYFNIDPHFGTLDEFKELIQKAHDLNIYVFLDCSFGENCGIVKPSPSGLLPTMDYEGFLADNGEKTYTPTVVYPQSLEFAKEVIRYWTSLGVDGWRLDSAYSLCQNGHNYWEDLKQVQLEECQKRIDAGEQWGILGLMLGEEWGDPQHLTTIREGGLDAVMDTWWHWVIIDVRRNWGIPNFKKLVTTEPTRRGYRSGVNPAAFLSNHDMARIYDRIGNDRDKLRMLHAAIVCTSQPVINYYGDEFGDKTGEGFNIDYGGHWSRTSGHLTPNNAEEEAQWKETRQFYRLRSDYPALWRGKLTSEDIPDGFVITKVDSETGQTVIVAFPFGETSFTLPGACIDLLSGESVEGNINLQTSHPRFFLLK